MLFFAASFVGHCFRGGPGTLPNTNTTICVEALRYLQSTDDAIELGKFLHMLSETVPESIQHGYKPWFDLVHCFVTILLSVFMAFMVPMLKGEGPSLDSLQPLIWILVPLHWTFAVGFWMRQPSFDYFAIRARDADIEKNGAMIDLLYCRQWLRAYDSAYPVQHVRRAFDEACSYFCQHRSDLLAYKSDTQWVARYFGELTKVFGILFGGYAALQHIHYGEGQMTLGRFTVFLSLYSIIIDVIYMFIDSWDGLLYAGVVIEELCQFANTSNRLLSLSQPVDLMKHPVITGNFVMKLSSVDFYLEGAVSTPSPSSKTFTLGVPLGHCYGLRTYSDASSLRRRLCEVLGGMRSSSIVSELGCAKALLLKATKHVFVCVICEATSFIACIYFLHASCHQPAEGSCEPRHWNGVGKLTLECCCLGARERCGSFAGSAWDPHSCTCGGQSKASFQSW